MTPQNSRTILGVDPGTGRCGFAILAKLKVKSAAVGRNDSLIGKVENSTKLVSCGVIETPAKTSLPERLQIIFEKISDLIKKYRVEEMAVEELFFVKNIKTGISVSHARGVIMLAGRLAGVEISEYKPNEIKLAIAGYGHATKEQIMKMLPLYIKGCKLEQDDAADAVAIALHHMQSKKFCNL